MSTSILQGDVLSVLEFMPSESVHCIVTSPPYWGLRDYGVEGQIGLERSLGEHIDKLVTVFREARRVLRHDGTFWLNYGDAYASAPNGRSAADTKAAGNDDRTFRDKPISTVGPVYVPADSPDAQRGRQGRSGNLSNGRGGTGDRYAAIPNGRVVAGDVLKPKDRMLLPARVAIALCDDGWWLRDEIIWHKPNPMPSSVKDRTTPAHEMIYMFSKNPRYFYNQEAVLEPCSENTHARMSQNVIAQVGSARANAGGKTNGNMKAVVRGSSKMAAAGSGIKYNESFSNAIALPVMMRNPRSVWTVSPKGFKEAHFATFPPDLIRPCILAGCPADGIVLDPFFGAGTTGLVASELGRSSIGIEINPEYIAIARKRLGLEGVFA
jgi:DNA modification methylase